MLCRSSSALFRPCHNSASKLASWLANRRFRLGIYDIGYWPEVWGQPTDFFGCDLPHCKMCLRYSPSFSCSLSLCIPLCFSHRCSTSAGVHGTVCCVIQRRVISRGKADIYFKYEHNIYIYTDYMLLDTVQCVKCRDWVIKILYKKFKWWGWLPAG